MLLNKSFSFVEYSDHYTQFIEHSQEIEYAKLLLGESNDQL